MKEYNLEYQWKPQPCDGIGNTLLVIRIIHTDEIFSAKILFF
jgi:hypothetical protein